MLTSLSHAEGLRLRYRQQFKYPPWGDAPSPRLWNLHVKQAEGLGQCVFGKVRADNLGEGDLTGR